MGDSSNLGVVLGLTAGGRDLPPGAGHATRLNTASPTFCKTTESIKSDCQVKNGIADWLSICQTISDPSCRYSSSISVSDKMRARMLAMRPLLMYCARPQIHPQKRANRGLGVRHGWCYET